MQPGRANSIKRQKEHALLIIYLIAIAARSEARIISTAQAEFFGGHVV
jgi:hypothetical protein